MGKDGYCLENHMSNSGIIIKINSVAVLKKIIKLNLLSFTQDALIKLVLNAILTEEMNISPNSQYILQKKKPKQKLPKMTI